MRGPLNLLPGLYLSVMDNASYYFFTGGGTVLTAIEQGSPYASSLFRR